MFEFCNRNCLTGTVSPELFHRNYSISACAIRFFGSLMAREKTLYFSFIFR